MSVNVPPGVGGSVAGGVPLGVGGSVAGGVPLGVGGFVAVEDPPGASGFGVTETLAGVGGFVAVEDPSGACGFRVPETLVGAGGAPLSVCGFVAVEDPSGARGFGVTETLVGVDDFVAGGVPSGNFVFVLIRFFAGRGFLEPRNQNNAITKSIETRTARAEMRPIVGASIFSLFCHLGNNFFLPKKAPETIFCLCLSLLRAQG